MMKASVADYGTNRRLNWLSDIAADLAELVQLMSVEEARTEVRPTRSEVAPRHLAEMEAVIEAAFAHVRERADADFFTMPPRAAKHYAAVRH